MADSPWTFDGYDVQLRPIRLDDVDAIMEWINDPDVTRNFAEMGRTITRDQELAFLQSQIDSPTDRLLAVETRDGQYLGNAGLHKIYWPARNGRIGIVLGARNARGRGFGQQAMRLLVSYGFLQLDLHKIWLVHYAENHRMRHLASKLGFQTEGVLREEYFNAGVFHDMVRHSLLEQEFESLAARWGITGT